MSSSYIIPGTVFLILGHITVIVLYRLYFHPLAKYPGPFWARISAFPAYYYTLRQDRHIWFWKLQERYGPTFRITPNSVLINTPTGLKTIYNNKANVKKAEYYRVYPRNIHAVTTWNSIDKTTHARKRRVMNHAFSDKALRSCEPFIHSNIDRWIELLDQEIREKKWSGSLNMARWADHLVFDTLGELCFGKSFGMKEHDSELRHIPTLMTDFMSTIHPIAYSPFAYLWAWLKPRGLDYLLAAIAPPALSKWQTFVEKCFTERARLENEARGVCKLGTESRKDFFHYLFHAIDPDTGKGYSNDELFGERIEIYISQRRRHQGGAALYSCQYLRAFIDETMRMSPPVPADLAREVQEGGIVVDGQYIPKGMKVSTASYCMHHNPDIYPEPFKFRPERWIVDENDECGVSSASVCLAESAFMPFSTGPRGCVGKNLAYLEMSLALAKVVYHFEIRRDNSSNLGGGSPDAIKGRRTVDQYQLGDIFVANRDGPLVQLTKRT
ncbi:Cytochrome P450 monooxygenase AKT7 [Fusarium oxysporum f. sp. raphani]|uniref:Cytochrome P450 monooxygenase AKT7 n=1 Tax=Fusarium oxysporum f. sp. raphani TaxID=96318 RepID=A0A8J5NUZ5_FUSOX|nr:Cytochrome P450 monooxygenase AKT7 [Fusarium oxysporum f. sp. raphani]